VRGGHECAKSGGLSAFQGLDGSEDAFVFLDHMARAAFHQVGKVGGFELRGGRIAEGFEAHAAGGFETLLAAFIVFAADEGVFHSRIDDQQAEVRREREGFDQLGAAIEEHKVVLAAKHRRSLVEQAAVHSNEFVFRAAAEFGDFEARERERIELEQERGRGDLDRGGTREARAARQGRGEVDGKSAGFRTGAGEHFGDTERVIDPFSGTMQAKAAVDFFDTIEAFAG
jgi:hypothetical protein